MPRISNKGVNVLAATTCGVPTLLVTGDSDRLIPRENSEIMARLIPESPLCVIPRGGHVFIHEHPDSLFQCILSLREQVQAASS